MKAQGTRLPLGFRLLVTATLLTPVGEALSREGLSLTCSLPKKTFLLGEPVTLTCRIEGEIDQLPREPWFLERATFHISVRDPEGGVPKARKLPYPKWTAFGRGGGGASVGVDVRGAKALVFQRSLTGSLFVPAFIRHSFSLEMRRSPEMQDLMVAHPRYGPGDYSLRMRHEMRTKKAMGIAGGEFLQTSVEFRLAQVPEEEKRAFELISFRPPTGVAPVHMTRVPRRPWSMERVMGHYRYVNRTYPQSTYAIWATYFRAKVLIDGKRWFEAAKVLDELPAADKEKLLPNYELAYLRALCAERTGYIARAREILAETVPEGVMVFLDCAETGRQCEGWRLFQLQRGLGKAPGEERPGYGPRPPVPRALDGVFNETAESEMRKKAVEALPDELPPGSLAALRWLLRRQDESERLRKALVGKLRKSGDEQLALDLTEMLWDETEAPRRRSSCVDDLRYLYEDRPDPRVMATLLKAAEADDEIMTPTAIWSLVGLAAPRDGRPKLDERMTKRIKDLVLAVAEHEEAPTSVRTTGILCCAHLRIVEALPVLRTLAKGAAAKSTSAGYLWRIAIEALGDLGNQEDVQLLEQLAKRGERLVGRTAKRALQKISARAGPDAVQPRR